MYYYCFSHCFMLLVCTCYFQSTYSEFTVHVDYDIGNNDPNCLHQHQSCKSLEYVSEKLGRKCSGLVVFIESSHLPVSDIISFENCTSLSINGKRSPKSASVAVWCAINQKWGTGFQFNNVINLSLSNIEFNSCGYEINFISFHSKAAMHVHNCTNVALTYVTFYNSSFTALVMSDTSGSIVVQKSHFLRNHRRGFIIHNRTLFPGGVHVQFSSSHQAGISYVISDTNFMNNVQQKTLKVDPFLTITPKFATEYGYGLGGGMGILFMNGSENINILVERCNFTENIAYAGAGLYIHFEDDTGSNVVAIKESNFLKNNGTAGGGLAIGMSKLSTAQNYVYVNCCNFNNNTADYGGGTVIFSIHGDRAINGDMKLVTFHNSMWQYNFGNYSPAVDILAFRADQFYSGYLLTPLFTDCTFSFNRVLKIINKHTGTSHLYSGIFVLSSTTVYFGGTVTFLNNEHTALKMTSASVHLEEGTKLNFTSNHGTDGGAIAMYGFSALVGNKDCLLSFYNNSASSIGGGIFYQTIEQREFVEGKSCFLQYQGPDINVTERNLTFLFVNNSARYSGTAIYAISFYSCFFAYHRDLKRNKVADFLNSIGTFIFRDGPDNSTSLGTEGMNFQYNQSFTLSAIPGQLLTIPISINNEFLKQSETLLIVKKENGNQSAAIFSNNITRVYGRPQEHAALVFRTNNVLRNSYYSVNITFTDCPPGFYFDPNAESCNCSADNRNYSLKPIVKCNKLRAMILKGYWAGIYINKTQLYVSSYSKIALSITSHNVNASAYHSTHFLPKSKEELNHFMCGEQRKGALCGECIDGYSAYYHSQTYKCGSQHLCKWGVLFYIISELIPVVVLFSIILRFNIDFDSGYLNGLILYCQIADVLSIDLSKLYISSVSHYVFQHLQHGYRVIHGVFNFEFFGIEPLSFCLWKGAGVMDVIVIKYVTTLFTFALIFVLVKIMNWQCCGKIKHSVTKGLSAFLLLCYSQCTKITFQVLSREVIVSSEGTPEIPLTAYGGLPYLGLHHIIYSIPALVFLSTLVFLPLVYLLFIPLLLQLLNQCGLSEHAIVNKALKVLWQARLMPLIDTFQSCFKPNLRFFAGVYFAYRVAIFGAITFSQSETQFYAITELILLMILGLHAIAQPYKSRRNNVVDGLLFLNLAVINGLNIAIGASTVVNYFPRNNSAISILILIISVQITLVFLPMVIIIFRLLAIIIKATFPRAWKVRHCAHQESYEEIDSRRVLLEDSDDSLDDVNAIEDNSQENTKDTY